MDLSISLVESRDYPLSTLHVLEGEVPNFRRVFFLSSRVSFGR